MITRTARSPGTMAWAGRGLCRDIDPERLFVLGADQHIAKRVCRECPVTLECLTEALDSRMEFGVWGGLTERERRLILTSRPEVTDWRPLLTSSSSRETAPANVL